MAASPYAKKLAREAGVDYSQAKATGPGGRIVAADVQKLVESGGGKADQAAADAGAPEPAADAQVRHWDPAPLAGGSFLLVLSHCIKTGRCACVCLGARARLLTLLLTSGCEYTGAVTGDVGR